MKSKLSVIVPIYNTEPYLRQCLDSVVNQTYSNLEIILIDDGSPDSCGSICEEYANKDSRIVVIHKENRGLSAAWNDGMRTATGDWIAFVDSDDWLDTDYFENIMMNAESIGLSDADVVIAGGRIDEKEKPEVVRNFTYPTIFCTEDEKESLKIRIHVSIKTPAGDRLAVLGYPWDKLFRVEFIKECGLWYDESMRGCADMLFDYQAFDCARKVIGCDYYGYHYRYVTNGVSKKYSPYRPIMFHVYIEKLYEYIYAHGGTSGQIIGAIDTATLYYILSSLRLYFFHPQNQDSYREIAEKIRKMKEMPRYASAIHARINRYMSLKIRVFKMALCLPWIWPIKALCTLNEKVLKR